MAKRNFSDKASRTRRLPLGLREAEIRAELAR
jgi:hypothetical protein